MSYSMFQEELQVDAVSPGSNKTTIKEKLLFWGGLVFALIQFIVQVYVYLIDLQLRAIHVGIGIYLAFLIYPFSKVLKK